MKNLFKYLVLGSLIIYSVWFLLPLFWQPEHEDRILHLLSWNGYGGIIEESRLTPSIYAISYAIISLGLFFFKKWARTSFFVFICLSILLTPFWGIFIGIGFESMLIYIVNLMNGATLAIAYLTSVNNEFE